jgi:primary-amine oxidase
MIDGLQNQVVQVDIDVDEAPVQSDSNFYGNGFRTFKKVYETAKGAVADYDASKCRSWVIENPNKKHYCSGGNVGYKISKPLFYAHDRNTEHTVSKDMPPMLAKPGSLVYNRAPFARHNVSLDCPILAQVADKPDVCHAI